MKNRGYRTALGGLLSAFSVVVMLFGSILPFATYVVPVVSSVTVVYFCIEYSKKHALMVYIVISVLSIFFVPDIEIAFLFAFIFGPYPILKSVFEQLKSRYICLVLKLVSFNLEVLLTYYLLLKLFASSALVTEFIGYSSLMLVFFMVSGNVTFMLYDITLTRIISIYIQRIGPKLSGKR
ncbi:MAG: hypothetical protein FWG21_01440 [Oscillospiraceae bacterium]|nr:hypothetical protein [Oscillospiraceae bacterium]